MLHLSRTVSVRPAFRMAKTFVLASVSCFLILLILFAPNEALRGARVGLTLCGETVIPSLFPFLALSAFVINTGLAEKFGRLFGPIMRVVFRLPGSAAAALALGIIGGYPVGAKACAELCRKGLLSTEDGNRLLSFCINSSPAFVIGAVGAGMLHSAAAGVLLYCAHLGASLLIGIFSGLSHKVPGKVRRTGRGKDLPVSAAFVGSVTGSAQSIINICAFVIFFIAITSLLNGVGILGGFGALFRMFSLPGDFGGNLLRGLLEVTGGCAFAAQGSFQPLLMISAVLSWSGLSVICQIVSMIAGTGLSVRGYLTARAAHIALSVALTILLFHFFPVSVTVFASMSTPVTAAVHTAPASAAMLIALSILLLSQAAV